MTRRGAMVAVLCVAAGIFQIFRAPASAQSAAPDLLFTNGKVVTVDERFTIAQAVAVKGDRIVAVGSSQEMAKLAGPGTRTIDLRGRTAIPGLIDNHLHLLRAGNTWELELRWDGVYSRKQAIEWFATTNGSSIGEVTSEVDRYCAWPGQACGYKVGHSEINRLREKAAAELGARFDQKAFNDTVLLGGNVPLDVLARNVEEYVRSA